MQVPDCGFEGFTGLRSSAPFDLSATPRAQWHHGGDIVGAVVTVSASTDKFFYWRTDSKLIDIALPSVRSFKFAMPSSEVTIIAQEK